MTKYQEDAVKLLEQVIPFFNPDYTRTVRLMTGLEPIDIPLEFVQDNSNNDKVSQNTYLYFVI